MYYEIQGSDWTYNSCFVVLEECLEMAGAILLIRALLLFLADQHPQMQLTIRR